MTPTAKLRFVRKRLTKHDDGYLDGPYRISLQQWWEDEHYVQAHLEDAPGLWRDVPIVEEK
jgi:hypothetical protein